MFAVVGRRFGLLGRQRLQPVVAELEVPEAPEPPEPPGRPERPESASQPDPPEGGIRDRTEPWVLALDETPEVGDAVK